MKKNIITLALLFLGIGMQAQVGFKLGVHGGLPLNDFNDEISMYVGVDLGYMWNINETIDLGVTTSYVHGIAETYHSDVVLTDLTDIQFIPVAASVRLWPSNSFSLGVEVGQAFGLSDAYKEDGLYYRPIIGFLFGTNTEINVSYSAIQLENKTWNTVGIGFLHSFNEHR